jgi:SAM-dependent methyltransferase
MSVSRTLSECVACGAEDLDLVLDLGNQPLANDYLEVNEKFEFFPLALMRCESCFHGQLSYSVDPARLFRNYAYVSGTSDTLYKYFISLRDSILKKHGPRGKILDIGSNDGTFLSVFKESEWAFLGIDPAVNLIPESAKNGVITIPTFFNPQIASLLADDFDVVVAMNVFAHTPEPLEILKAIKAVLSPSGTAYIQTSQANMFENGEFDTVYHEHISFFNVRSMKALLSRAGLELRSVEFAPVHGNSYVWVIGHESSNGYQPIPREQYEEQAGLYQENTYKKFAETAVDRVARTVEMIESFRGKGYKIASYGAAAKGNTFLNFGDIKLDYIFDDTPQKIGKYAPAGGVIVSNPNSLVDISEPLLTVIPAWNFKEEIVKNILRRRNSPADYVLVYFPQIELKPLH